MEGYYGPLMMLISGSSDESDNVGIKVKKWIIGALTQQGFENKDLFYGTSGSLYAISPIFDVFSPSGNYLYICFCTVLLFLFFPSFLGA